MARARPHTRASATRRVAAGRIAPRGACDGNGTRNGRRWPLPTSRRSAGAGLGSDASSPTGQDKEDTKTAMTKGGAPRSPGGAPGAATDAVRLRRDDAPQLFPCARPRDDTRREVPNASLITRGRRSSIRPAAPWTSGKSPRTRSRPPGLEPGPRLPAASVREPVAQGWGWAAQAQCSLPPPRRW